MNHKTLTAIIRSEASECAKTSSEPENPPETREAFYAMALMLASLADKIETICSEMESKGAQ